MADPVSRSVKVFLIPFDEARAFFYSEDPATASAPPVHRPGLRGWSEQKLQRLKAAFEHPKGRPLQGLKHAWDWLQRRMHPHERMLAALRSAPIVEVYHPASLSTESARSLWFTYLRRRRLRHIGWLLFDATLAPLSLLLIPLPGPNVVGYWCAYRAVWHLLILLGIRRALKGHVETTFRPVPDLDTEGLGPDSQWLTRTARRYDLNDLDEFVARIATRPSAVTLSVSVAVIETASEAAGGADEAGETT
jgi:hypothetical protein